MTEEADVFLSLFSRPEDVLIADMVNDLTGLKISKGDGLPRFICKECSEDVIKSFKVRLKCLESDRLLRSALEKTNQRIKIVEFYLQKEIKKVDQAAEHAPSDISTEVLKNVVCDERLMEMLHPGNLVEVQETQQEIPTISVTIDNTEPPAKSYIKQEFEKDTTVVEERATDEDDSEKENDSSSGESPDVPLMQSEKSLDEGSSPAKSAPEEDLEYTAEYLEVAGEETTEEVEYTISEVVETEEPVLLVEKAESEFSQEEDSGKFICCGCEIHFATNEDLVQHSADEHEKMRLKKSAKPFECNVCFKRFLSEARLLLHQNYVYRDKNHVCDKCNAKFTCRGSLLNHLKTHADRTYVCEDCNKSFHTSSTLKSHRLLHTESKQFKCTAPNCEKSFLRKSDLHIHLVSHSDERPYECEVCSSRFKSKAHLVHHGKVHTREKPYKCNQCDKAFGTYSARKFHQLAHEGIHPYKCSYCNKIYQRNTKLQVHIRRIHTGERPFACDVCQNVRFYQNWELTAHKRNVHKMEVANEGSKQESAEGGSEEDEEDTMDEEYVPEAKPKRIKTEG